MVNETLQPAADYFLARCLEKTLEVLLSWPAAGCSVIFTVQTWEWCRPSRLSQRKQNVKLVLYRASALSDLALQHRYMYTLLQFYLDLSIFCIRGILLGWLFVLKGGHYAWGVKSKIPAQHADGCRIRGSGKNQSSHTHLVRLCFTQGS